MKAKPYFILIGFFLIIAFMTDVACAQLWIWANDGGDKVTQDELRAVADAAGVVNSVWDGKKISVFGARNEVVSFNLIIEAPTAAAANNITVSFDRLSGPGDALIAASPAAGNGVFNWVDRPIELFYIRYLQIKGLSHDLCYNALYDERHVPERFRRPWTGEGDGAGAWADRPDHDKYYPDIAVPLELATPFTISAGQNQSIWVDIYIPKTVPAGLYQGSLTVGQAGAVDQAVPVELTVRNFSLPDYPSAPTMLAYTTENINHRYLGVAYPDSDSPEYQQSIALVDVHFQLAHRHKISLIDSYVAPSQMAADGWLPRLSGDLFTAASGYDGPGVATGNNVYSIGTYGAWTWAWSETSKAEMWAHTDAWINWFDAQAFGTPTAYFLYLIDESDDYPQTEQWARWIDSNPGPGSRLMSMATISSPNAWENETPSLDIPTSGIAMGMTDLWESATQRLVQDPGKRFYYYNGARPASGTYCTEDDGVALRVNGWIQHKKKIDRWFYWESTYYDNYQAGMGQIDVFTQAQTFGSFDGIDTEHARGEYGWNYTNGDGVLFYPGTDHDYPDSSYGVSGPFASLRLKHWRRGIQDADYLALASAADAAATAAIVQRMVPTVLWEYGVENPDDPTYVYTDISWSTDPDMWEAARTELADLIEGAATKDKIPMPEIKANGSDGPITIHADASLTIDIGLDAGSHPGEMASWWILQAAPNGQIFYYDLFKSKLVAGVLPTYQGGLFNFPEIPLFNLADPSAGAHTFYFGVYMYTAESSISGSLPYDHVVVNVTGP